MIDIDRNNLKQLTYYTGLCRASKYDPMGHGACEHHHILLVPIVICNHTMTKPIRKYNVQLKN